MRSHTPHTTAAMPPQSDTILQLQDIHVYYGQSHALQGVNFQLPAGALAIIGRNGMGKTTLCNRIMGLLPHTAGTVRFMGQDITHQPSHTIANKGIGYVPQGRKLWHSLTVEDHIRLFNSPKNTWHRDKIYQAFPRLFERKNTPARHLSGGEQQMLAIARALLQDPKLLILDEPTEGLAPVIVQHVENLLDTLVQNRQMAILLIEQNIHTALALSEQVGVMVNGQLQHIYRSADLRQDVALQRQLLGVQHANDTDADSPAFTARPSLSPVAPDTIDTDSTTFIAPTRWHASPTHTEHRKTYTRQQTPKAKQADTTPAYPDTHTAPLAPVYSTGQTVYVVGTFDTKAAELSYIKQCLIEQGKTVHTVDVSTANRTSISTADTPPHVIGAWHPHGSRAVFTNDRGQSVTAMGTALTHWLQRRTDIGGIIAAGGSGAAALVSPAMQALPIGLPKVLISTMASGDVRPYVGASDIVMMNPVTDVQGLNTLSRTILKNGALALAGMVDTQQNCSAVTSPTAPHTQDNKPTVGLTMFGVTTPAVQNISKQLPPDTDVLVFHATGIGGQAMEKLIENRMLQSVIDITTTEVCDLIAGGVMPAHADRLGVFIRNAIPYVGSLGAVDMVNFHAIDSVPHRYKNRTLVAHNDHITLMRTNAEENKAVAIWLCERLNAMPGAVRFVIPEGGVSALDAPNQPFYAPHINQVLFDTIDAHFEQTATHKLIRVPYHINDNAFAQTVLRAFQDMRRP